MESLRLYEISIVTRVGLIYDKVGHTFDVADIPILGENEDRYCLNDLHFTRIDKKKSYLHTQLNKPEIRSSVNDTCWGSSLRYTLYTDKKKRKSTIKKEIATYIDKKFGAFCDVNLNFLNES